MGDIVRLIDQHGPMVVFVNVLVEQLGLPVPALPTLVVAGALAADGRLSVAVLFTVAVAACIVADSAWYLAGRLYGNRVMKALCRVSLTPDACVSQTQTRFERWGINALVVAKFVPGLAMIAPPLAGATRIGWARFMVFNTAGAALWVGAGLGGGLLLKTQVEYVLARMESAGTAALALVAVLLAGYILLKWWERHRFFALLRASRISVDELYRLVDGGQSPLILDVRTATARSLDRRQIPGTLHVPLHAVDRHARHLERDREVIVYCTCPNEASAAEVAKLLMDSGFKHVRPLQGGLDAWVAAGYAVEVLP